MRVSVEDIVGLAVRSTDFTQFQQRLADAMSDDKRKSLIVGNLPEETVAALKDATMSDDDTEKLLRDTRNVSEVLNRSYQEFARLELVERVAKAMAIVDKMDEGRFEYLLPHARAAIKAVLDGINAVLAPPTD